jgi:hypothetical protein
MLTLLWMACLPEHAEKVPGSSPEDEGDGIVCNDPVEGFMRLTEAAAAHGIVQENGSWTENFPGVVGGSVAAEDLDGDGDIDLSLGTAFFPAVYKNDGRGNFERVPLDLDAPMSPAHAVMDLDGDGLPEILIPRPGMLLVSRNLGGMQFAEVEVLWEEELPYGTVTTATFGDVDGDGDLDAVLPQVQLMTEECQVTRSCSEEPPPLPAPTLLLRNEGSEFVQVAELAPEGGAAASTAATFTDRDQDGDLDLIVASERSFHEDPKNFPPTAFYRNDGVVGGSPALSDDAPEIYADLIMSGMGIATTDLNEDGILDYCITDTGLTRCLVGDGAGAYYEVSALLGLRTKNSSDEVPWSAWSIEILDFDNDGYLDVATAAGQPLGGGTTPDALYRDAIWRGTDTMAFEEMSDELGFTSEQHNFGLAAADFDGDGYLEIVVNTSQGKPLYWQNHCGDDAWLEVEPRSGASFGYGARVEVEAGGRRYVQEVQNLRAFGQSPSRLHFGLGPVERVDLLRVRYLDGRVVEQHDVPVRQVLRVE